MARVRKAASDTPITDDALAAARSGGKPAPKRAGSRPRGAARSSRAAAPDRPAPSPEDKRLKEAAQDVRAAGGRAAQRIGASDGAGVLLALVVWCWVAIPFLKGGPTQVKDVLRAKFLNRGPKGEELP